MSAALGLIVLLLSMPAQAANSGAWFPLRTHFEGSPEPLTPELVWAIEPDDRNWHRRFWVLDREVKLEGLAAVRNGATFSPQATGIVANAILRLRAPNSTYFSRPEQFPCALRTSPVIQSFSTYEGASAAGAKASELWAVYLEQAKLKLAQAFTEVRAKSEAAALLGASRTFNLWLAAIEDHYDDRIVPEARRLERIFYERSCASSRNRAPWTPGWEHRLPAPGPVSVRKLVARAPAKRWRGLYSVRVAVEIGGQEMNGAFLVDTGAPTSIVSPTWLQAQGMNPKFLRAPGGKSEDVRWSFGKDRGYPILVDRSLVGGQEIPVQRFLIAETQNMLGEPQFASSCCDGILGTDFLSQYAVEFDTGGPSGLNLYARTDFDPGPGPRWAEVAYDAKGALQSEGCGVSWNTGTWSGAPPACPGWGKPKGGVRTVGMDFLGRGSFTLDLPHGRIWLSPELFEAEPPKNRTGLKLAFEYIGKEKKMKDKTRVLKVDELSTEGAAASLAKKGLFAGAHVVTLAGMPVDRLDAWEVDRVLSGGYGKTIRIAWEDLNGKLKRDKFTLP